MPENIFDYIIVGSGLAAASAAEAIRGKDKNKSVLILGEEKHLPYDRPPLSKKLWSGKMRLEKVFLHDRKFYDENKIQLASSVKIIAVDAKQKSAINEKGDKYFYDKLLLATGGFPRKLNIPGADLEGIYYYRFLDDYLRLKDEAAAGKKAVVIGGGFIGSEIACALNKNNVNVTMIFPEEYLCSRVFPDYLGLAMNKSFIERGINIINADKPVSIEKINAKFLISTGKGKQIESDILVVGIGISPETKLAETANLSINNGIVVNEFLRSSNQHIYAAGDNAFFPYQALGKNMRIEHWDNSLNQGKCAGRNMAGEPSPFDYMPYFFSDLFEFGYEAVGEVNSELETFADWTKENNTGVIYYLKDNLVRGVMMCNIWKKVDIARGLIKKAQPVTKESLRGLIA